MRQQPRHHRSSAATRRGALVPVGLALLLSACSAASGLGMAHDVATSASASSTLAPTPPPQPPPLLTPAQVDAALGRLDGVVHDTMTRTGVPGMAVGVVYRDRVVYLRGFGVRRVGRPAMVDPDTVFQLASVSKPLASTVVAGAVGDKAVAWDDPVSTHDTGFALKSRWVSSHVTLADLFAHRSGLPDHAGDLLEDLHFDRAYILRHLRDEPLAPFRASYAYTNFGFTEAALAAARAEGTTWEDLSSRLLYRPLGMGSTSSRFADYEKAADKAVGHVRVGHLWRPRYVRDADAQAPAGGASSTVRDMTQWIRLQLANGRLGAKRVIDETALLQTHLPHIVSSPPRAPAGRTDFYGLGWNVGYDDHGRLMLSHSGAFALGAATSVTLLPSEQLGIVILTNGAPVGAPEAVARTFLDIAQDGKPSVDWLGLFGRIFAALEQEGQSPTDYSKPPAHPVPAGPQGAYVGTYANGYYGRLTIRAGSGGLVMQLGPGPTAFALRHYDRDIFSYRTQGENAVGLSGVTFARQGKAPASRVTVENLDHTGLGTFTRR
jgi:CubicO group peptidase (beta-lactamase class C family)